MLWCNILIQGLCFLLQDDDDEEVLERKVEELERRISENPYHYEDHIDLIQALWWEIYFIFTLIQRTVSLRK